MRRPVTCPLTTAPLGSSKVAGSGATCVVPCFKRVFAWGAEQQSVRPAKDGAHPATIPVEGRSAGDLFEWPRGSQTSAAWRGLCLSAKLQLNLLGEL